MAMRDDQDSADVLKLYDEVHSNTEGHRFAAHYDALNAVFDAAYAAGVAEGIRQAREAAANVDPVESALQGSDAAVQAIDALKP